MHPTTVGTKMEIPRAQIPMPDGALPALPQDNARAAHSDEILVLEGDGEGAGDYLVADLAIKFLQQVAAEPDKPFFLRFRAPPSTLAARCRVRRSRLSTPLPRVSRGHASC